MQKPDRKVGFLVGKKISPRAMHEGFNLFFTCCHGYQSVTSVGIHMDNVSVLRTLITITTEAQAGYSFLDASLFAVAAGVFAYGYHAHSSFLLVSGLSVRKEASL